MNPGRVRAIGLAGGALTTFSAIGWLAVILRHIPGSAAQKVASLGGPALDLSSYLVVTSIFGVAYTTRTLVSDTGISSSWFWAACALLAWLGAEIVVAGRSALVFHLPAMLLILYAARPREWLGAAA